MDSKRADCQYLKSGLPQQPFPKQNRREGQHHIALTILVLIGSIFFFSNYTAPSIPSAAKRYFAASALNSRAIYGATAPGGMVRGQEARSRIFTKRFRPNYGLYLLCWVGLWVLLTVTTQLPECYQCSMSLDAGTLSAIHRDLAEFAATRALYEVAFGLFWGSISWALHCYGLHLFGNTPLLKWLRRRGAFPSPFLRPVLAAIILAAFIEGAAFGVPLAALYTSTANFSMLDDAPPVTISDQSILVEAIGIVLAFVVPTLAAGWITDRAVKSTSKLLLKRMQP